MIKIAPIRTPVYRGGSNSAMKIKPCDHEAEAAAAANLANIREHSVTDLVLQSTHFVR